MTRKSHTTRLGAVSGIAVTVLTLASGSLWAGSGAQVVERFLDQIGGRSALERVESIHATGSYSIPAAAAEGTIELFYARPDSLLMTVKLPFGTFQRGLVDGIGFANDPQRGPRVLEGPELEQLRLQAMRGFSLLPGDRRIQAGTEVEKVDFEGRPCLRVSQSMKGSSMSYVELYDVESGLMVGREETVRSAAGSAEMSGVAGEYKQFGKIRIATYWQHEVPGQMWEARYESIELNAVDRSVFVLPDPVKAMVDAEREGSPQ